MKTPTFEQISACIKVYHKYPCKDITVDMIKEARKESGLSMMLTKSVIEKYIEEVYSDK